MAYVSGGMMVWVMRRVDGYNTFGPRFALKIQDLRPLHGIKSRILKWTLMKRKSFW